MLAFAKRVFIILGGLALLTYFCPQHWKGQNDSNTRPV
jgi:hypothetical protein